jgi:hypothetical protein
MGRANLETVAPDEVPKAVCLGTQNLTEVSRGPLNGVSMAREIPIKSWIDLRVDAGRDSFFRRD